MPRHGENIRQRKDGRWEARVIIGKDECNHSVYHSIYGKSYEEVKAKKLQFIQNGMRTSIDSSTTVDKNTTFKQLTERWLSSKKLFVKESTYSHYVFLCSHYIIPYLGNYLVKSIDCEKINMCLTKLQINGKANHKEGLSSKSIIDIRTIILAVIKYANENHVETHLDGKIFIPSRRKNESPVFTHSEQDLLEKYLITHLTTYTMGIILDLYTGIRIGELCALKWKNIDFDGWLIYISKTLQRIPISDGSNGSKTKLIISEPKTPDSRRIIPVALPLQKLLTDFRSDDDDYLLTGSKCFIEPRNYYSRYKRILRKLGLPSYSFHALRHTFATRCIENRLDVKTLSEILGHSEVRTTMQLYVHPSMDDKRDSLNSLAFSSDVLNKFFNI